MNNARITVQYVNPPKQAGWSGSVKTNDGAFYGVNAERLQEFTPGQEYDIEFESKQGKNGRTFHDIKSFKPAANGSTAPAPSNGNGHASAATAAPARGYKEVCADELHLQVAAYLLALKASEQVHELAAYGVSDYGLVKMQQSMAISMRQSRLTIPKPSKAVKAAAESAVHPAFAEPSDNEVSEPGDLGDLCL